ncbi:MAG: LamG-like jellyroll fold domain-containing protein [Prevotella sp.]
MNKKYITTILIAVCSSLMTAEAQDVFPQDKNAGGLSDGYTLLDVVFNGDGTAMNATDGTLLTRYGTNNRVSWDDTFGRFKFTGNGDYAGTPKDCFQWNYTSGNWTSIENGCTLEAFIKTPSTIGTEESKILAATQGGGIALMISKSAAKADAWKGNYNPSSISFLVGTGTSNTWYWCSAPTPVQPDTYYHIVGYYGGNGTADTGLGSGTMVLFINGQKVQTVTNVPTTCNQATSNSQRFVIGGDPSGDANGVEACFPGEILLARVYASRKTEKEDNKQITALYNNIKVRNTDITADLLDVVYDGRGYAYDVSPSKKTITAMKARTTYPDGFVMEEISGVPSSITPVTPGGVWKTNFDANYGRFTLNSDDVKYDEKDTNTKEYGGNPQHFYVMDYRDDYEFKRVQLNGFSMELVVNDNYDLSVANTTTDNEAKWFASTEDGGTAMMTGDQTTTAYDRNMAFIVKTTGKDHYIGTKILPTDAMGEIGAHYAAEIGREEANTMTQTIEGLPKGWYRVSCQGFVTGGGTANLIANDNSVALQSENYSVLEETKTAQQRTLIEEEQKIDNCQQYNDNVAAATLFDADPTKYNNEVWVYVGDDGKLTIGMVKVSDEGRAFVDNFQLAYGGDVKEIYLSATKTAQETRDKAAYADPMRFTLRRGFAKDTWNALSLPVSIPASQLKANFQAEGTTMKLYKLEGIDANRKTLIRFRKVDLDKADSEGLLADECYVIWPTKIAPTYDKNKPYTYTFPEVTNNTYTSVAVTTYDPLYHFDGVTAPGYTATKTKDYTTSSGTLKYTAYYDKPQSGVSGKFYMVEDGVMYYATSCPWLYASYWILEDVDNVNPSKDFTMLFDDETTGIGSVESLTTGESRVYNLNGQMMGTSDTNALRKGVYIVNGKKIVVR